MITNIPNYFSHFMKKIYKFLKIQVYFFFSLIYFVTTVYEVASVGLGLLDPMVNPLLVMGNGGTGTVTLQSTTRMNTHWLVADWSDNVDLCKHRGRWLLKWRTQKWIFRLPSWCFDNGWGRPVMSLHSSSTLIASRQEKKNVRKSKSNDIKQTCKRNMNDR